LSRDTHGRFLKGSRPVGRAKGIPDKVSAEIRAAAAAYGPKVIAELRRLALHATNEATRVAACKELLDRAIGKAVQPHSGEGGEGPVIVQVITGVPRSTHFLVPRIGDTNAQSPGAFEQ
jgi:hypothetical protein